jgi:hypothetical protein
MRTNWANAPYTFRLRAGPDITILPHSWSQRHCLHRNSFEITAETPGSVIVLPPYERTTRLADQRYNGGM